MKLVGIFFVFAAMAWPWLELRAEIRSKVDWFEAAKFIDENEVLTGFLPKVSVRFPDLTIADAYLIQDRFIAPKNKQSLVAGYKAGFTSEKGRETFGLRHPVSGVLHEGCRYKNGVSISLRDHPGLMLELELGFRIEKAIIKRPDALEDLDGFVSPGFPVIELPKIRFRSLEGLTGIDLVSVNMASACWIESEFLDEKDTKAYDLLEVSLYLNEKLIDSGLAGDVNGPRQALLWLIRHLHDRNIGLGKGLLLLTGKIGKINQAKPGEYMAIYGDDSIKFQIRP